MCVLDKINKLKGTTATNDKVVLLKEYLEDDLFSKVVELTYNPIINFYVKKFDTDFTDSNGSEKGSLDYALDELISKLASRDITGNSAIELVEQLYSNLSISDREVFKMVLNRSLECGISITTINKAKPKFILDSKKQYMRCSIFNKDKFEKDFTIGDEFYIQEKMDGLYTNYLFSSELFLSRSLKTLKLFDNQPEVFTELIKKLDTIMNSYDLNNYVLQGELLVQDKLNGSILPRELGNGMLNSKNKIFDINKYEVVFYVWDIIKQDSWEGKIPCNTIYKDRLELLYKIIGDVDSSIVKVVPTISVTNNENFLDYVVSIYKKLVAEGKEGIVIKYSKAYWEGKTSKYQLKYKKDIEVDLKVVDVLLGKTGKNKGKLSILVCASSDGKLKVNVGS